MSENRCLIEMTMSEISFAYGGSDCTCIDGPLPYGSGHAKWGGEQSNVDKCRNKCCDEVHTNGFIWYGKWTHCPADGMKCLLQ